MPTNTRGNIHSYLNNYTNTIAIQCHKSQINYSIFGSLVKLIAKEIYLFISWVLYFIFICPLAWPYIIFNY